VYGADIELISDKADLEDEREIGSGEGEKLAASWGCSYHETSAVSPIATSFLLLYRRKTGQTDE
jgi:hypothetical protein